jgi:hypothetical protein
MRGEVVAKVGGSLLTWLVIAAATAWLAPGWLSMYWRAEPVADETMACTPAGLQSGAPAADGAPTIPMAMPPSTQPAPMPAARRYAVKRLIFIVTALRMFESIPDLKFRVTEPDAVQTRHSQCPAENPRRTPEGITKPVVMHGCTHKATAIAPTVTGGLTERQPEFQNRVVTCRAAERQSNGRENDDAGD